MSKFKNDYPEWEGITKDLDYIFNELIQNYQDIYGLQFEIEDLDYFKNLTKETEVILKPYNKLSVANNL